METWVRFSAQSHGRERLLRVAQFACVLVGDALRRNGGSAAILDHVTRLEAHLGLGRKLLRLGSSADALDAAKRSIHLSDAVLRFCITLSHLNRAMYLACDNVLWAGKVGVVPVDQEKWGHRADRYFLFSILLNLSRDMYEIRQLMEREATGRRSSKGTGTGTGSGTGPGTRTGPGCGSEQRSHAGLQRLQELRLRLQVELRLLLRVLRGNPPLLLDLVKNLCDLCIPLERLRLRRCGAAVLGLCGVTSSLLSIVTILQPWLRLKP